MIQRLQNFAVYGVIVDGNRILLVQKSKGPFKGLWDLPGGIIQYGESPETTLLREILEETGLEVGTHSYLKSDAVVVNYTDEALGKVSLHHVGFLFKINLKDLKDLVPKHDDEELICTKWCDLGEVEMMGLSPFLQELLMELNG
ncbi:MAG: NUDIX domain-containing protein [Firmicutes bacterium]|nr:NUDIX domain-containing protein [Bacillota bacterium]